MTISGANFERHRSNISWDILDSVFYKCLIPELIPAFFFSMGSQSIEELPTAFNMALNNLYTWAGKKYCENSRTVLPKNTKHWPRPGLGSVSSPGYVCRCARDRLHPVLVSRPRNPESIVLTISPPRLHITVLHTLFGLNWEIGYGLSSYCYWLIKQQKCCRWKKNWSSKNIYLVRGS